MSTDCDTVAMTTPRSDHTMESSETELEEDRIQDVGDCREGGQHQSATGSAHQEPDTQPTTTGKQQRLSFTSPSVRNSISGWLREARDEFPVLKSYVQTELVRMEIGTCFTHCNPLEDLPVYLDGVWHADFRFKSCPQIAWCSMLYGSKDEVRPKLQHALTLGWQLRTKLRAHHFGGGSLINVLFVAEGSINREDLKALATCWSIRPVQLPIISKPGQSDGLPHRQANGVKTAEVLLKIHASELETKLCIISDVEMYINWHPMGDVIRDCLNDWHYWKQLRQGATACIQKVHNCMAFTSPTQLAPIEGEMSYALAMFIPCPDITQKLQNLISETIGRSSTVMKQRELCDLHFFDEIFERPHVCLPSLAVVVPAWINNPHTFENMLRSFQQIQKGCSRWYWDLANAFTNRFGAIHFTYDFNLTRDLTVEAQRDILEEPFRGHTDFFEVEGHEVYHSDFVGDVLQKLMIQLAEGDFEHRQEIQHLIEDEQRVHVPALAPSWNRVWELCETDTDLWDRKLPWEETATRKWLWDCFDPSQGPWPRIAVDDED